MTERVENEGNPYSKWNQMIRDKGYSKPVNIELATVTEAPPNLKITLDADGLPLEKGDLIVSEYLTKHKRTISIRRHAEESTKIDFNSTNVAETMTPAGTGPHTHDITALGLKDVQNDFTFEKAELEFTDELKVGDRVIVACLDEDMVYVILDRAVWYV